MKISSASLELHATIKHGSETVTSRRDDID
jgi:hypothetical protein